MSIFTPKQPPMEGTQLVATVYNQVDAEMVRELLRSAGIPSLIRPKFGMDPLPVLAGSSVMGEEIYVDEGQVAEATTLIAAFTQGDYTPVEEEPQE